MSLRAILVLLNDLGESPNLLDAASILARQHDAHLTPVGEGIVEKAIVRIN